MTTKRESILNQIATTLAHTAGISGRIYRSRVSALARAESPAMVVEPVRDDAEQNTSLPTLDWSLTVRVAVIVRSSVPDQAADAIVEDMHSRLMTDLTVGGYAIDVQPDTVNFELVEADQPAGVISCSYIVRYRTAVGDLTTS
ncbi:MAG: hypothetical protein EBZ29_10470 [Synechococcaceae bacterium WB9_4xC_028]|nr:hypothetical protein [Synechococcaceae bacterium WB9_4xB_025]NDD69771.1 hypothetical protein [Synechococcaceae bacterium WB9_4xC_028]